jgi:hypothetical protein
MLSKILKDEVFNDILTDHTEDVLEYLLGKDTEFGILCNLSELTFNPELPKQLAKTLKPLTLFILSGYTLESAEIDFEDSILSFEAGFGEENYGSIVSVPIDSIIQIAIDDTVVHINLAASIQRSNKRRSKKANTATSEKSINSFLSNPENKKFAK